MDRDVQSPNLTGDCTDQPPRCKCCYTVKSASKVTLSDSAAFFGNNQVPPPVAPGGLTKKRADYLIRMADHVRTDMEAQFMAKIRSFATVEEEHGVLAEIQPTSSGISAEQEAPAVDNQAVSVAVVVMKTKLTQEAIIGLIQKSKEPEMTYAALARWVEAEYSIKVSAGVVGYNVRKALAEVKKRNP